MPPVVVVWKSHSLNVISTQLRHPSRGILANDWRGHAPSLSWSSRWSLVRGPAATAEYVGQSCPSPPHAKVLTQPEHEDAPRSERKGQAKQKSIPPLPSLRRQCIPVVQDGSSGAWHPWGGAGRPEAIQLPPEDC